MRRLKELWSRHILRSSQGTFTRSVAQTKTFPQDILIKESTEDPIKFWQMLAEHKDIKWSVPPTKTYQLDPDRDLGYKWYGDGMLNMSENCLDTKVANGMGSNIAIYYDSAYTGFKTKLTYSDLLDRVEHMAGGLQNLGVVKGDRVMIYMPNSPEAIISVLACSRIGAIHSVVFGGFAPEELKKRIDDCEPKVLICTSIGIEPGKEIAYKPLVDQAIELSQKKPERVIVYQRRDVKQTATLGNARDIDWDDVMWHAHRAKPVAVEANHPLYILYTSGTTGSPKGVIRETCTAIPLRFSMEKMFDVDPGESYFAASDVGWVVGHSYIIYAPLLRGCSTLIYEGKPIGTPDAGAFFRLIQDYKVCSMFTAPTAFRAVRRVDPEGVERGKYDISSLRSLFLAGERADPNTIEWLMGFVPEGRVVDHWWQTEVGYPITGVFLGAGERRGEEILPIVAGSAGKAFPGYDVRCVKAAPDEEVCTDVEEVGEGEMGEIVVKLPLPPGSLGGLWNNPGRMQKSYFTTYTGYYRSGDSGFIQDGNINIMSRVDDVINVAGHRLSTFSIEEVISEHPDVAECCVIGVNDTLKGQEPIGVVVLKDGAIGKDPAELQKETVALVRQKIGAVAAYKKCILVTQLPKTRSGKILRKSLREIYDTGDISAFPATIDDPETLNIFKRAIGKI